MRAPDEASAAEMPLNSNRSRCTQARARKSTGTCGAPARRDTGRAATHTVTDAYTPRDTHVLAAPASIWLLLRSPGQRGCDATPRSWCARERRGEKRRSRAAVSQGQSGTGKFGSTQTVTAIECHTARVLFNLASKWPLICRTLLSSLPRWRWRWQPPPSIRPCSLKGQWRQARSVRKPCQCRGNAHVPLLSGCVGGRGCA
jgi:hypothetical protein